MVNHGDILDVIEAIALQKAMLTQQVFNLLIPVFIKSRCPIFFVKLIAVFAKRRDNVVNGAVKI